MDTRNMPLPADDLSRDDKETKPNRSRRMSVPLLSTLLSGRKAQSESCKGKEKEGVMETTTCIPNRYSDPHADVYHIVPPPELALHAGPSTMAAWKRDEFERQMAERAAQKDARLLDQNRELMPTSAAPPATTPTKTNTTPQIILAPETSQDHQSLQLNRSIGMNPVLSEQAVPEQQRLKLTRMDGPEWDPKEHDQRAAAFAQRISADSWLLGHPAGQSVFNNETTRSQLQHDEAIAIACGLTRTITHDPFQEDEAAIHGLTRVIANGDGMCGATHLEYLSEPDTIPEDSSACTSVSGGTVEEVHMKKPRRRSSLLSLLRRLKTRKAKL